MKQVLCLHEKWFLSESTLNLTWLWIYNHLYSKIIHSVQSHEALIICLRKQGYVASNTGWMQRHRHAASRFTVSIKPERKTKAGHMTEKSELHICAGNQARPLWVLLKLTPVDGWHEFEGVQRKSNVLLSSHCLHFLFRGGALELVQLWSCRRKVLGVNIFHHGSDGRAQFLLGTGSLTAEALEYSQVTSKDTKSTWMLGIKLHKNMHKPEVWMWSFNLCSITASNLNMYL